MERVKRVATVVADQASTAMGQAFEGAKRVGGNVADLAKSAVDRVI